MYFEECHLTASITSKFKNCSINQQTVKLDGITSNKVRYEYVAQSSISKLHSNFCEHI